MGNTIKVVSALFPSLVRLGRGAVANGNRGTPPLTLELYDCENDPECRPVREALTVLDLEVMVYPVPENGERFRKQLAEMSGSDRLPFLHDPNTGERLQGAESVVNYLYAQFAPEGEKSPRNLLPLARVASTLRGSKGKRRPARQGRGATARALLLRGQPLFTARRESLCELEIPYLLHNVGKSPGKMVEYLPPIMRENKVKDYRPETENRRKLVERGGHMMVPYLVDPNTGTSMYQSPISWLTFKTPTACSHAVYSFSTAEGQGLLPTQRRLSLNLVVVPPVLPEKTLHRFPVGVALARGVQITLQARGAGIFLPDSQCQNDYPDKQQVTHDSSPLCCHAGRFAPVQLSV